MVIWMKEYLHSCMDGCIVAWVRVQLHGCLYICIDGCIAAWMLAGKMQERTQDLDEDEHAHPRHVYKFKPVIPAKV